MDKTIEITFDALKNWCYPSVTDYCRMLVEDGVDYTGWKIHVYRGEVLCLIVNNIYDAAKLMPTSDGFSKYKPFPNRGYKAEVSSVVSLNDN